MDSVKNSKTGKFNFILKLVKLIGVLLRGLKCKSACCNSECLTKKECNEITLHP